MTGKAPDWLVGLLMKDKGPYYPVGLLMTGKATDLVGWALDDWLLS